jgi:hypothetical protein
MKYEVQFTPEDPPRVELVEEIPTSAEQERRSFIAGAVAGGLLCAIAGYTYGFVVGLRSREGRMP